MLDFGGKKFPNVTTPDPKNFCLHWNSKEKRRVFFKIVRDSVRFSDYFFKVIRGNRFGYQVHFLKVEREKAEAERQRRLAQEKLEREKAELERQQRLEKEKVERELAEQERKLVK